MKIVEMLYTTNIIAVVGKNERMLFTPRRLTIWDTNASSSYLEMSFPSPIIAVRLNKHR